MIRPIFFRSHSIAQSLTPLSLQRRSSTAVCSFSRAWVWERQCQGPCALPTLPCMLRRWPWLNALPTTNERSAKCFRRWVNIKCIVGDIHIFTDYDTRPAHNGVVLYEFLFSDMFLFFPLQRCLAFATSQKKWPLPCLRAALLRGSPLASTGPEATPRQRRPTSSAPICAARPTTLSTCPSAPTRTDTIKRGGG